MQVDALAQKASPGGGVKWRQAMTPAAWPGSEQWGREGCRVCFVSRGKLGRKRGSRSGVFIEEGSVRQRRSG